MKRLFLTSGERVIVLAVGVGLLIGFGVGCSLRSNSDGFFRPPARPLDLVTLLQIALGLVNDNADSVRGRAGLPTEAETTARQWLRQTNLAPTRPLTDLEIALVLTVQAMQGDSAQTATTRRLWNNYFQSRQR